MADTTIKVDSAVRDRLAILAAERGLTIRDFVAELANGSRTQAERDDRLARSVAYIRTHLIPEYEVDVQAEEQLLRHIEMVQRSAPGNYPAP
jgi:hypothetical protein